MVMMWQAATEAVQCRMEFSPLASLLHTYRTLSLDVLMSSGANTTASEKRTNDNLDHLVILHDRFETQPFEECQPQSVGNRVSNTSKS